MLLHAHGWPHWRDSRRRVARPVHMSSIGNLNCFSTISFAITVVECYTQKHFTFWDVVLFFPCGGFHKGWNIAFPLADQPTSTRKDIHHLCWSFYSTETVSSWCGGTIGAFQEEIEPKRGFTITTFENPFSWVSEIGVHRFETLPP